MQKGGRLIDFGLVSRCLAPKLKCEPTFYVPFKPHIMAIDFVLEVGYVPDLGNELINPTELAFTSGPREAQCSWCQCLLAAREEIGQQDAFLGSWKGQAPWNGNASSEATWSCAIFSNAAERYALANNQEATEDMRARAWRVGTRITIASLACPPEHFYRKPMLAGKNWVL